MYGMRQFQTTDRRSRRSERIVPATQMIDIQALPRVRIVGMDYLPDCPAVYGVLTADESLLYIGCTSLLRSRWKAGHHRITAFLEHQAHWILWYVPRQEENRFHIEREWILRLKPPLNDQPRLGSEAERQRERHREWYAAKYGDHRTDVILTCEEIVQHYAVPPAPSGTS